MPCFSHPPFPPATVPPTSSLAPFPPNTVQQVAFADKILLNKVDLVTEEQKQAVIKRIRVRGCGSRSW